MDNRPNILLLMTDQQRFDSLSCYGCKAIRTPNLDRLAAEGALFENCYVNNPLCTPSRCSLFTGKPLQGHGVYHLYGNLPDEQILFPEYLRRKGYQTALIGKLHVSAHTTEDKRRNANDGFDIYEWCLDPRMALHSPYNAYAAFLRAEYPEFFKQLESEGLYVKDVPAVCHFTRWAADRTIHFLDNRDTEKPFFCYMSLFDPHSPYYDRPPESLDMVDKGGIPAAVNACGGEDIPSDVKREMGKADAYIKRLYPDGDFSITDYRSDYYASIAFLDQEIGRVLKMLDEKNLRENTLVLFVSDHGDMLLDRGLRTKGAYFYDACTKVPLIMRFPGAVRPGARVSALVQPHDIAATILTLAGYANEELCDIMPHSLDLLPITGEDASDVKTRDHAVCVYRNTSNFNPPIHATMYRNKRYKLNVYHKNPMESCDPQGELFDMENDPAESVNLWNDPKYLPIRLEMTGRLLDCMVNYDVAYRDDGVR